MAQGPVWGSPSGTPQQVAHYGIGIAIFCASTLQVSATSGFLFLVLTYHLMQLVLTCSLVQTMAVMHNPPNRV